MRKMMMTLLLFSIVQIGYAELEKGPYMIYPGVNTQMQVLWQLTSAPTCTIGWGTTLSYSDGSAQVNDYGNDNQYSYTITGLTPGTKYYYYVDTGTDYQTGSFTAAPADSAADVKFLAYGDTRSNPGQHNIVAGQMIDTYTIDPDFQTLALLSGDWINSENENDWANQFFPTDQPNLVQFKKDMPINGCRGNHEGNGSVFSKYYPYPYESAFYWSFDYGPLHVVVLDQYVSYTSGSAQYNWLVNDLANSTKEWKVIVLHAPGWSAYGGHGNDTTVQNTIHPLCLQYGVDILFGGHNHYYARCDVDGIQHITTGGGGAPLRTPDQGAPNLVLAESTLHHCEITITGYQLDCVARRGDGSIVDSFTIQHTPPVAPDPATNPNPADTATDVSLTADISWDAGAYAASHDVYFGTDSTPDAGEFAGNQTSTVYDPGILSPYTTYYWAIDEVNITGTTTGPVWSFTTGAPDSTPPTPNPATFAVAPTEISSMAITMTATTGTDPSGPVEYYFDETSGNPGGTDSGWQTSPSYSDSGLANSTQYTYTVQMRDAIGNTGTASAPASATTDTFTVFYYDAFDNDGLATNAGIGGGLEAVSSLGVNWVEDGDLFRASGSAGDRAVVSSLNAFDLSGGFTLTVKWVGTDSQYGDSFGLSHVKWTTDAPSLSLGAQDPFGYGGIGGHNDLDSVAADYAYYGIGLAYATTSDISDPYDKGLIFNDASGIAGETGGQRQQLSNPTIPTSGTNTFVLTVTTDDQYSYSINGAPETTGEIVAGAGTFDLTQPFYFNAYSQNGATTITEVIIEEISGQTNNAPSFTSNPINEIDATEDAAYSSSISDDASDPESDPMTFSKASGPAWLSVATDGTLSGTPTNSDVGANVFTVQVDATGGSDTATLNITVINTNDAPTFTADPISRANATEDAAYSDTIAASATDPDVGDTLTYSKVSGPAWLSVASDGSLSGTPATGDIGANSWTVQVDDGNGGTDTAALNITVDPVSVGGTVVYHDTFDNDGLSINAGTGGGLEAVSFLDNGAAGSGVNWVEDGDLFRGSGTAGDRAVVSSLNAFDLSAGFTLTVKWTGTDSLFGDSFGLSTERWTTDAPSLSMKAQDPFGYGGVGGHNDLDSVAAEYAYYGIGLAYGTTGDIDDPYDKGLIFNDASGIAGETGGQRQQLSLPTIPTSGSNTFVLTVTTDDQYSYSINGAEPTTGEIVAGAGTFDLSQPFYFNAYSQNGATTITEVIIESLSGGPTNNAPSFTSDPINEIDATEDAAYSSTIADDASDPESDPMTFSKTGGPAWLSVAANGDLSGTPANSDVGLNVFTVQVTATGGSDTATLNITVINTNDAPTFTVDPINKPNAEEDVAYSDSIAGSATDQDAGDTPTYSKTAGPAWLSVAANGALSGTPGAGDVGANAFTVQADDGNGGTDTATLNITVDAAGAPVDHDADGETTVSGTVSGSYADTMASDDVYEALTEVESGGKPANRHSLLEHTWTINIGSGGSPILSVEAYHTANSEGDDFVFAYSSDNVNFTDVITVTKTADDNTPQTAALPGGLTGTVYIRVTDTDSTQGNRSLDTVYVDDLHIQTSSGGTPDTDPPTPDPMTWATLPYATGSSSISMTATTASDPSGVEYYFTCTAGGGNDSGWQDSATYEDTGLSPDTTYTYTVMARDKSANQNATAASTAESATTDPAGTPPAAPSGLSATAISQTQIDISWTDNATNETGFKIERSVRTNGSFAQIDTVSADITSYSDITVSKGKTYFYRVRATNADGDSAYSNEASATTPK